MNVDSDNFSQVRQFIMTQKLIQKSELISFDLQFAGLKFQGNDRDRSQYMPSQKYQKMSAVARKYCIMQIGITFFITQQKSMNLTAYPFNFYVFPRPTIYGDPTISLQSGCVSFNITNKMDWNRWIQKGITYMKLTQYERINDIQQKAKKFEQLFLFLQQKNKSVVKEIIAQVQEQQQKGNNNQTTNSGNNQKQTDQKSKWYELPTSSFQFVKKVIEKYFQQHQKLYIVELSQQSQISMKNKEEQTVQIHVIRISAQQREKIDREKLEQIYGFTLLFQKIWNSGKSFVGHNFFFDILFMYDAFIAALPYDYNLFKKNVTQVQNLDADPSQKMVLQEQNVLRKRTFYDTKLISNNLAFKFGYFQECTSLEAIYKWLLPNNLSKKQIDLPQGYERYDLKNQIFHQAGFDSYLTGWVYYQMAELAQGNGVNIEQHFRGKVNLNRSYFHVDFDELYDEVNQHQRVFYIEVIDPKKYVPIEHIKKQRSEVLATLWDIFKQENIAKQVIMHEGLKQVFIEIKEPKNYQKITAILVKNLENKKIKDLYSLVRFLTAKNAKQWADSFSKNVKNMPIG